MRFHPLIQNSSCYFYRLKWVYRTQALTSLQSHFRVQLSTGSPFQPTNKNQKYLRCRHRHNQRVRSTLYARLQHAFPPTNTKLKPLLFLTQVGMPYTNTHKHRTSYFKSTLTFLGPAKRWKCIFAD